MARSVNELRLRELPAAEFFDNPSDSEEDAILSDSSQEDSEMLFTGDNIGITSDLVEVKLEIPISPQSINSKYVYNIISYSQVCAPEKYYLFIIKGKITLLCSHGF